MAATCPKCSAELPRQLLWKALKSASGAVAKVEIKCPQCSQVLRIIPRSLTTILVLANLHSVPIVLWIIIFLPPTGPDVTVMLVLVVLMPLMTIALSIVFYLRLARFQEKRSPYSIRG
jgi:hypothetical protein